MIVCEKKKGFTLVELMITIAIVTILSSTAILNYYGFNDRLSISSAGQEMAVNIRQSQTYGLNVKETGVGAGDFSKAFGVYFSMETGENTYYIIFVDKDGDKKYDADSGCGSGSTECLERVNFQNGVNISFVDAISTCPSTNAARYLTITFLRPDPDADINFFNNGGNSLSCSQQSNAQITLVSRGGRTTVLTIERTGQIHVQ
jgi:prepilin-type N-terminal cleavage/methylation domain-containing protein